MSDDYMEGYTRKDVACDFAVPVEWVPENWAELSDDDLLSAVEAARDREIRLQASPLYGLLRRAEDDLDLPGGAAGGVAARRHRKPTTAAERSRARVRFTFQAVEDPTTDGDK